jgi:competence protein ComEC
MTSLVLLAVILDRSALNMRLVALAALFVMITTPEAVTGPSFVLSFAAVAALIVFYRDVGRRYLVNANAYKPYLRPLYYLFGIIVTSVIATLATAPFSVMFFNRFAVYSVISNILAMPVMAFIVMPIGLISTLLIPFNMDHYLWGIMEAGIEAIVIIAHAVSAYDYSSITLPTFTNIEIAMVSFGFIWILLWNGVLRFLFLPLIIIAFITPHTKDQKSIVIAEDASAVMIVDKFEDNLYLIGKLNSYTKSNWLNFYGIDDAVDINSYWGGDKLGKSYGYCDNYRCRMKMHDYHVSIITNPISLKVSCIDSDMVISFIPVQKKECGAKHIIDRFDIWRRGAMRIEFDKSGFQIHAVKGNED